MKSHGNNRTGKRAFAFFLVMLLGVLPQTSGLFVMKASALNMTIANLSTGTLNKPVDSTGRITHYELNYAEDVTTASFNVSIDGPDFTYSQIPVTFLANEGRLVSAISVNNGGQTFNVLNSVPFTVTLTFSDPAAGFNTGMIKLDLHVPDNPATVLFVINRGTPEAAADPADDYVPEEGDDDELIDPDAENDYSDYDGEGAGSVPSGMEGFIEILKDADYLPEIAIDGNAAKLAYVTDVAYWGGGGSASNVLTLSDVSRLTPDTPLDVPGPKPDSSARDYTVTLPAAHINAVLKAKAEDIAAKLTAGAYREEPEGHDGQRLYLVPSELPAQLAHTGLTPLTAGFEASGESGLAIYADAEALMTTSSQIVFKAGITYKGMASPVPATLTLPVSDAEAFPALRRLIGMISGQTGAVGGLAQEYDPESGNYVLRTDGGSEFVSEIPNGMATDRPAAFYYPAGMTFELFRNGAKIAYSSGDTISLPGKYSARGHGSGEGGQNEAEGSSFRFDFEILGKEMEGPLYYNAPPGYAITSVNLDGNAQDPLSGSCAQLLSEGGYELKLRDLSGASPELAVAFALRNEAPVLRPDGATDGKAAYWPFVLAAALAVLIFLLLRARKRMRVR